MENEGYIKLFKVWPSNNQFFCQGKLITGPVKDWKKNVFVWVLLFVSEAIFLGVCGYYLYQNNLSVIVFVSIAMLFNSILFLCLTQFTDPGIIPRKCIWDCMEGVPEEFSGLNDNYKYCQTCQIYRPPRASHCRECDNCVEVFDHHCPWVNNCIAKRNYYWFLIMQFSFVSLSGVVICGIILYLYKSQKDSNNKNDDVTRDKNVEILFYVLIGFLAIIGLISIIVVGYLFFSHMKQCFQNQTTKEAIRKIEVSKEVKQKWKQQFSCQSSPLFNKQLLISIEQKQKIEAAAYLDQNESPN